MHSLNLHTQPRLMQLGVNFPHQHSAPFFERSSFGVVVFDCLEKILFNLCLNCFGAMKRGGV